MAWQSLVMFCELGWDLRVSADDAVEMVLAVASRGMDETELATWLRSRMCRRS